MPGSRVLVSVGRVSEVVLVTSGLGKCRYITEWSTSSDAQSPCSIERLPSRAHVSHFASARVPAAVPAWAASYAHRRCITEFARGDKEWSSLGFSNPLRELCIFSCARWE